MHADQFGWAWLPWFQRYISFYNRQFFLSDHGLINLLSGWALPYSAQFSSAVNVADFAVSL